MVVTATFRVDRQLVLGDEALRLEAVQARTLMGRAFVLQRRWPEAIEQFERVLGTDAVHVEATGLIGDALPLTGFFGVTPG